MNRIHIEQLKVMASIGCDDFEQHIQQPLYFDVSFECDFTQLAKSDSLTDTIDYTSVCDTIEQVVGQKHYNLIEHLAQTVVDTLTSRLQLKKVTLRLSKPTAIKNAKTVAVSIQHTS